MILFAPSPVLGSGVTDANLAVATITAAYYAVVAAIVAAIATVATVATVASAPGSPHLFVSNNAQKVAHKFNIVSSIYSLTFRVLQSCHRPLIDFFPLRTSQPASSLTP